MGNTGVEKFELSLLKDGIRSSLNATKNLLAVHLKHVIHILLENNPRISDDALVVLKKSAEEINRSLAELDHINIEPKEIISPDVSPPSPDSGCSIKEILRRVVKLLRHEHYLDHLLLVESVPSDIPPLKVDPIDVEEIFYNLITNAAQATIRGGKLAIDALFKKAPDSKVIISFKDTGCGIPNGVLPYIFDPFYSEMQTDSESGYGLFAVKQLVERNGGKISIQSKHSQGTVVSVVFSINSEQNTKN